MTETTKGSEPTEGPCSIECRPGTTDELIDPAQWRIIQEHPCFSKEAEHKFGRIHVPVAPGCNVKCNYCVRKYDCVNESRPGVTSRVLTPFEAVERVKEVVARFPMIKTVGIAGPGEPLANEKTFETLRLLKDHFPQLRTCLSSNGLLLPQKVDLLHELDVATITVTMSAVDPEIGSKIYSWVNYEGKTFQGLEAARLQLSNQLEGIKRAVKMGMLVKVNSVMIPGINDHHLVEVARKAKELGVFTLNIMPLIPQDKFADLKAPTAAERKEVQDVCGGIIRQMRHCRQCRADAVGLLGQDLSRELFKGEAATAATSGIKVAVTGNIRSGMVDLHFENATEFLIYQVQGEEVRPVEVRRLEGGKTASTLLADCRYLITRRISKETARQLQEAGISVVEDYGEVKQAIGKAVGRRAETAVSGGLR